MSTKQKSWYELNPRPNVKAIRSRGGCKVAWEVFATEADARVFSEWATREGIYRESVGYDFGYQSPGSVRKVEDGWEVCTA